MSDENMDGMEGLDDGAIVAESEPKVDLEAKPSVAVEPVREPPPEGVTEKSKNRFRELAQERDYWKRKAAEAAQELKGKEPPKLEDFDHDIEKFTAAAVEHAADAATVKSAEKTAADADVRAQEELKGAFASAVMDAVKQYPDFEQVFDGNVPVTREMAEALIMSSKPAEIAYFLGAHRDIAAQIAGMPPHLQGYELARLEARISTSPIPSKAPPPPTVHVSGASASGVKSYEDMDDAEFERARAKERAEYRARHY